jgi:multidrug efflux pump subunit AcrB
VLLGDHRIEYFLYIVIPKGFFPQQDTGQLQGGIRGDAASSFQLMKRKLQEVAAIIQAIRRWLTVTGSVRIRRLRTRWRRRRSANVTIALKPLKVRRISGGSGHRAAAAQAGASHRRRTTFLQAVQDIGGGGRSGQLAVSIHAARRRLDGIARPGRRSCAPRCKTCRRSPTWIPICSRAASRPT